MIQVNDILLAARSRLNDTDTKKYRWSDEELIDYINSSLADISKEQRCQMKYAATQSSWG